MGEAIGKALQPASSTHPTKPNATECSGEKVAEKRRIGLSRRKEGVESGRVPVRHLMLAMRRSRQWEGEMIDC